MFLVERVVLFFILFILVSLYYFFVWNYRLDYRNFRYWVSSFECGFAGQLLSLKYFSFTYFILLVFFVVFDLEVSLLLNIPFQGLLYKKLRVYLLFLIVLFLGFVIEIHSGYIDWGY